MIALIQTLFGVVFALWLIGGAVAAMFIVIESLISLIEWLWQATSSRLFKR